MGVKERRGIFMAAADIIISNGITFDFDCDNFTGWADLDAGNGVSSLATFDGRSTFKLDGGATYNANNSAQRTKTAIVAPGGDRSVISFVLNHASLSDSTLAGGFVIVYTFSANYHVVLVLYSDKVTLRDSSAVNQTVIPTGVPVDGWYTFTLDITGILSPATAVADVYLNNSKESVGASCGWFNGSFPGGALYPQQVSRESVSYVQRLSYVDKILVGDDFA